MSLSPPLDHIVSDPIISTENITFSISRSRHASRVAASEQSDPASRMADAQDVPDEQVPLLGSRRTKKPFYRARPLWLVPFSLTASLVRGMTLASRVEIFTQLSCSALHEPFNHTNTHHDYSSSTEYRQVVDNLNLYQSLQFSLDPAGPHLYPYEHASFIPLYFNLSSQSFVEDDSGNDNDDSDDNEEEDPRVLPSKKCLSDPAVQAGAARLQTIMTTTMGTLSALTTGWWGHFSERHGRTRVLAIATFGLFLTDLAFILVSTPNTPFSAHGHKLLIIVPIIEGLLGGWSTLQGAMTSYIADCTSAGSRAHIFSRFYGVGFFGLALGPALGAFFIKHPIFAPHLGKGSHPLQTVTSVFWIAIACSFINLLLVSFVFPESLTSAKRLGKGTPPVLSEADDVESSPSTDDKSAGGWVVLTTLCKFLSPLAVFMPKDIVLPGGKKKTDWSLTFLALVLFGHMLASGLFQIKYLYAEHVYEWSAEGLSYYISLMGLVRALVLLFVLPFVINTFKPKAPKPLNASAEAKPKPTKAHLLREVRFDIVVTRCLLFIDMLSHALVTVSPLPIHGQDSTFSQVLFVSATSLASFGSGVNPAVQSLALCMLQIRALVTGVETDLAPGKLFGALAVLQAVGQTILGPMLYGLVYSATVGVFPKAIFATAAAIVVVSLAFTAFIRPIISSAKKRVIDEEQLYRGRSRVSKDLRGGAAGTSESISSP